MYVNFLWVKTADFFFFFFGKENHGFFGNALKIFFFYGGKNCKFFRENCRFFFGGGNYRFFNGKKLELLLDIGKKLVLETVSKSKDTNYQKRIHR